MSKIKKRIFEIIQIGSRGDVPSTLFDIFIIVCIVINLGATFFGTYKQSEPYKDIIDNIEYFTAILFAVEYVLRVWTADYLYPGKSIWKARGKFIISFYGIVDFFTFLPTFLPGVFMGGIVVFRIFRVFRILRLFRINSQYDAFNVIIDVIKEKKDQLISSICMIFILMMASSLCMYQLEHEAQPEMFENAFSGMWWSVSTLLTVGYGDIYPVTVAGRIMAIIIAFLGVGMVAIPTGIISAGFVEYYSKAKDKELKGDMKTRCLYELTILKDHEWKDMRVKDLDISRQEIVVLIERNDESIVPQGNTLIREGDKVFIYDKRQDNEIGSAGEKSWSMKAYDR